MSKQTTIELNNLSTGYIIKKKRQVLLQNINASLRKGELTCLLGANGIGKSTLLRTLSGFQPKLGGEVKILGKEIESYSEKKLSTLLGIVLTEKCDVKDMSVYELVSLGRSPYTGFWGTLTREDKEIVEQSIAMVKIEYLANRMLHTLSDGERQKAMIAKTLAQQTPVIFLDEPTAFLDFQSKVEIMQLLHHLSRETGKTIFLSTHDLELALQIADKIWLIDQQSKVCIGIPEDLALAGKFSSFFAHKGIVFDMETGLFRIENKYTKEIRLNGHGQKYAMIRKALLRNGIYASKNMDSPFEIEVGDLQNKEISIHLSDGSIHKVQSIEELLSLIDKSIFKL